MLWITDSLWQHCPPKQPENPLAAESSKHLAALDGIRGIAILTVCVFHFHFIFNRLQSGVERLIFDGLYFGWVGVDLFFALSWFLITGILLDSQRSPRYFTTFYARRALRIFRSIFLFLGVAFWILSGWSTKPVAGRLLYFLYLQNWFPNLSKLNSGLGHLWSLAIEEQFYLTWPLVVWLTPRRNFASVCLALALTSAVARTAFARAGLGALIYECTVTRMDGLILGGLAAFAFREPRWRDWLTRQHRKIILGSVVCVISSFLFAGTMDYSPAISNFGAFALAVIFSTIIFRVALVPRSRVLNSAPMQCT